MRWQRILSSIWYFSEMSYIFFCYCRCMIWIYFLDEFLNGIPNQNVSQMSLPFVGLCCPQLCIVFLFVILLSFVSIVSSCALSLSLELTSVCFLSSNFFNLKIKKWSPSTFVAVFKFARRFPCQYKYPICGFAFCRVSWFKQKWKKLARIDTKHKEANCVFGSFWRHSQVH